MVLLSGVLAAAHAQMVVSAPGVEYIMEKTHVDQIIYYVQMIEQQIQAAQNTYNQYQNMIRAEQRALENLKGITSVNSFDEFMNWYNRQLYLERQAENRFKNLGIKIGGKNYKLADIEKIPDATSTTYVDYWDEFSPQQRRQMYLNLGMTPANYAYVQTWKAKEKEIFDVIMTNREVVNEENMAAMERNNEILARAMNEDVGEKGVMQAILEVLVDTNRATREGNLDAAAAREWEAARARRETAADNAPVLSDWWGQNYYRPIDDD
jgi:ASC-1-like (ASCH) protein